MPGRRLFSPIKVKDWEKKKANLLTLTGFFFYIRLKEGKGKHRTPRLGCWKKKG